MWRKSFFYVANRTLHAAKVTWILVRIIINTTDK